MNKKLVSIRLLVVAILWISVFQMNDQVAEASGDVAVFSATWNTGSDYGLANTEEIPGSNVVGYSGTGQPTITRAASGAEGVNAHSGDGYLQMQGTDVSVSGGGYIYNKVYENLDIKITYGMKLKYWVYHHSYPASKRMGIDLIFTDTTNLRDSGLTDLNGVSMHPGSRNEPLNKWVLVETDLSPLAGKTIDRILFAYSGDGTATGKYASYFDDLTIQIPGPGSLSPCTLVTPGTGESLGQALANALTENNGAPASFCARPGLIDVPVNVSGPVSLTLYPGTYMQTQSITLSGKGASLIGQSRGSTILKFKNGSHGANVVLDSYTSSYKISGLTLGRETEGTLPEDNGIRTGHSNDYGLMESLIINKQYNGMHLQITSYTRVRDLIISESGNTGMFITNGNELDGGGPCQYYLDDILFTVNKGFAIDVSPDAGPMPIGNWNGILTFGNEKGGIILRKLSDTKVVHGLRLTNSFFGQDGGVGGYPEITLEGGGMHNISNSFVEIGGVEANPPYSSHADVHGILIDEAVTSAQLNAVYVANNTGSGLVIKGGNVLVTASTFSTNGMNSTTDDYKTGILILNEDSIVNVGLSQFIASGAYVDPNLTAHSTGIKSYSEHVTLTGVTFDTSGGAQGYVGP
ncbi:hypothetical protein [Paenibacillus eucommiae]|uniref:Uncharacterized protein n=1 Tax=Paenibacillus eucommiae TaxID=1355755 RepID=A0ABS4IZY3_9BACL|nr:hypothetical protein [Paenibacillus eucommiae]MBP1993105.1 hypothetical protein [Paenibacillus eucommiae]